MCNNLRETERATLERKLSSSAHCFRLWPWSSIVFRIKAAFSSPSLLPPPFFFSLSSLSSLLLFSPLPLPLPLSLHLLLLLFQLALFLVRGKRRNHSPPFFTEVQGCSLNCKASELDHPPSLPACCYVFREGREAAVATPLL